ncbi:HesA/MoeB/ThiF family protein [Propionivibrio dicarboxylicus]|uniref:ThiF family protein n=1 Tax=Propionivibrio dicarboxylicus TaxID=83767 RepID=A0A1G7VB55_9RHOO|nr:ThiF family adenylyltransferase [Propionivibrio dicarboxylicus]SDG56190.1 ThiF family protein [Propionivibrio dicarboxylicus]
MVKPFAVAAKAVEAWITDAGRPFATRVESVPGSSKPMAWKFKVSHPRLLHDTAKLSLPRDFPATPAQIYLHKDHCLVLPHVEETGKVCLGVEATPDDYANPVQAIGRVLSAFEHFLTQCNDEDWIASELRRECWSYWMRFCDKVASRRNARPTPKHLYVAIRGLTTIEEGSLAIYLVGTGRQKVKAVVACHGDTDPHSLARRHGISDGQLARGTALFVPLPIGQDWRPGVWPQDFEDLDMLVGQLSDNAVSVISWLQQFADKPRQLFLVAFVQGQFVYAYQLCPPLVQRLTPPAIEPLPAIRLDAEWSLTRGYGSDEFASRQDKRVLVLGCGSLGSPVIELLARAGVGSIIIVDPDLFLPENCSRHVLGLSSAYQGKATRLAERLTREIPGVTVQGVSALASSWVSDRATPGMFDLVVDCTGESSVRALLSQYRHSAFQGTPIAHAWLEPFCAAAHVVLVGAADAWPMSDPADALVNAAEWPESTKHEIPACGAGFHPYGVADTWQAAGFAAERLLSALGRASGDSAIWSWVRSKAYFDALNVGARPRAIVPLAGSEQDSRMLSRGYDEVLNPNG